MAREDKEKISFIMDQGTYYYNVIPLRLKNVSATFQLLNNKVFVDRVRRNVKAYVNDIVIKSMKVE